jgi:urease accessory protein
LKPGQGEIATAFVGGASAVVRLAAQSPLKLIVARERGPCARVFAASFGGGLLAGDEIAIEVEAGAHSTLAIGTSAPGKVYRSDDGRASVQRIHATVRDDALLGLVPGPLTCFRGARYDQSVEIDLAPRGSLILTEALTSGRSARGERWIFDRLATRTRIRIEGALVLHEAVELVDGPLSIAERFGAIDAFAIAVLLGPRLEREIEAIAREVGARPAKSDDGARVAASTFSWGVVLRFGAESVEALERSMRDLLSPVLLAMSGGDGWHGPW